MLIRSNKISNRTILSVALIIAAAGITLIALTRAAEPTNTTVANLWIDNVTSPSPGSCTRSSSPTPYSHSTACSSSQAIQQALAACNDTAGDIIRMVPGNYGSQTITAQKSAPGCSVIGDTSGAGVNVTGITPVGSYFSLKNINNSGPISWENPPDGNAPANFPHDLEFDNVSARAKMFIRGGTNILWKNSTIGPFTWPNDGALDLEGSLPGHAMSNFTLDNITFDGIRWDQTDPNAHVEIIRLDDNVSNVTIRNSTFKSNLFANSGIIFTGSKGTLGANGSVNGLLLENNFIAGTASAGFNGASGCRDWKFYNNTWLNSLTFYNCLTSNTNLKVIGNLGQGNCTWNAGNNGVGSVIFKNNVWQGAACNNTGTDKDYGSQSISYTGDGFHIPSGSPAVDRVEAINCLVNTDHDGNSRPYPVGGKCDAGAHEFGASSPPPTSCSPAQNLGNINCDSKVDIFDLSIILSNYGKTTPQASNAAADINNSGSIDGTDLSILLSNYGT